MTPLDRLAEVVKRMTDAPWKQCSGTDVRVFYELPSQHSHRMAQASCPENAAGIAALRNLAPLLIEVARAAHGSSQEFSAVHEAIHGCPGNPPEMMQLLLALGALDTAIVMALGEG